MQPAEETQVMSNTRVSTVNIKLIISSGFLDAVILELPENH
jgi:hypothetical protein